MSIALEPKHAQELEASEIPRCLVQEAGIHSVSHEEAYERGFRHPAGYDGDLAGWYIPYLDPRTGEASPRYGRVKLDARSNGCRYLSPCGERPRLYFVPGTSMVELKDRVVQVFIVEGEKKALALLAWARRHGERAVVVAIGGCFSWLSNKKPIGDLDLFDFSGGRVVILVLDSDVQSNPKVETAEIQLAKELVRRGATVKATRIRLGKNGKKRGVDDLFHEEGDGAWLKVLSSAIPHHGRRISLREIRVAAGQDPRPEIRITSEQGAVVDATEQALIDAETPIYSRGRILVEVSREGRRLPWLSRPAGAPTLVPMADARLRELMAATGRWVAARGKPGRKAKGTAESSCEWEPALPPIWAVNTLMARPTWRFPEIALVSECPLLRPDGSVISEPGFDDSTGVLFLPGEAVFPPIPESPSLADAQELVKILKDPIRDFPFLGGSDWSAALAAMMTPLARPAFSGPAPAYKIGAAVQGTGKTLLADVISVVGTGRPAPKMPQPGDEAEISKRILAVAIEALPLVVLDNLTGMVNSAALAAALTATEWRDRLLGRSATVTAPLTTMWIMTSNNPVFSSDIARRLLAIDLDARLEDPETRTGWKYPDLRTHLQTARPHLVNAALTILRAFHLAGCPKHGKPPMGSFEAWDGLIRAALMWVGEADPLEGRDRIRAQSDVELEALRDALAAWRDAFGTEALTAAQVVQRSGQNEGLSASLAALAGCPVGKLEGRKLGYALRRVARRIANGLLFDRESGSTGGVVRWLVREP